MKHSVLLSLSAFILTGCVAYDVGKPVDPVAVLAPGIYGNVRVSGESGDMRGWEIRLNRGGASQEVEVTLCESSCQPLQRLPLRRNGDEFSFAYRVENEASPTRRMIVTPMGREIILSTASERGADAIRLSRLRQEYGLAIARALTP